MRLFTAIPLPVPVRRRLTDLTEHQLEGVRWQKQQQLHITLKFLGNTSVNELQSLVDALSQIHQPAFTMKIRGIGCFPERGRPKIIWVGISNPRQLIRLHQRIEETCTNLGFEAEDRPFKPHITLGRVTEWSRQDVLSFINQHRQFSIPGVAAKEFVLYESKLRPGGAEYEKIESIPLDNG